MMTTIGDPLTTTFSVDEVVRAWQTVLDPQSTANARQSAETFLAEFKASPFAQGVAIHLIDIHHHCPPDVRLFGLHVLDHLLEQRWNTWSMPDKLSFRESILTLASQGLDPATEKNMIKEKLSKLVAAVALREWPQHWPDFVSSTLTSMLTCQKPILIEMALIAQRILAEDIFIDTPTHKIDEQRLIELKSSLTNACFTLAQHWQAVYSQLQPNNESLFAAFFKMLAAYVEWMPFKSLESFLISSFYSTVAHLPSSLLPYLLDALYALANRPHRPEEQTIYESFVQTCVPWLHQKLHSYASVDDDSMTEEDYLLLKRMAQVLCDFGTNHITHKRSTLMTLSQFPLFLECILLISCHKSALLSSLTLSFWIHAFKSDGLLRQNAFVSVLPRLLEFVTGKLMNAAKPNTGSFYFHADFESLSEYEQLMIAVKARLYDVLKCLSKFKPVEMLQLSKNGLQSLCPYELATVGKNPLGCTTKSLFYLMLEGNVLFLNAVLSGMAPIEQQSDSSVQVVLHQILEMLLGFDKPDALCLVRILDGIIEICLVLKQQLIALNPVMGKVMPLVTFNMAHLDPSLLNEERKEKISNVRRKAANILVKLASIFAPQFLPYYQSLINEIQALISSSHVIGLNEKASLIEFLMVISQNCGSDRDRSLCYQFICGPILSDWQSESLTLSLSTVEKFITFYGIQALHGISVHATTLSASLLLEAAQKRTLLQYLCNATHIILKRLLPVKKDPMSETATAAFNAVLTITLPFCLRLIQYIHNLWNVDVWKRCGMSEQLSIHITVMTAEEKRNLLGMGGFERNIEEIESPLDRLAVSLRIWLGHLRMAVYSIMSDIVKFKELYYASIGPLYWECFFTDVQQIQLRHLKHFIQLVIHPLICECPEEYFERTLRSWLPSFFSFMTQKLDEEWRIFSTFQGIKSPSSEDQQEHLSDEVVQDKLLRSVTHAYATLLFDMLVPLSERGMGLVKTHSLESVSPLVKYLLSHPHLSDPLLSALVKMFFWKDSSSCDKALQISQRLVVIMAGRSEYMAFIGQTLVVAALQTLSDGYHQELHDSVISLLTLIYQFNRTDMESVLSSIPSIQPVQIDEYRSTFDLEKETKKKKAALKQLLRPVIGVKISSLFRLDEDTCGIKSLSTKLVLSSSQKEQSSGYDWKSSHDDDLLGLPEFFA